jgi:hypothetical protein
MLLDESGNWEGVAVEVHGGHYNAFVETTDIFIPAVVVA